VLRACGENSLAFFLSPDENERREVCVLISLSKGAHSHRQFICLSRTPPAGWMYGWLAGGRVGDVSARGAGSEKFIFESETQLCHIDNGGNMVRGAHDLPKKLLPR
jgi:hypothetical protein